MLLVGVVAGCRGEGQGQGSAPPAGTTAASATAAAQAPASGSAKPSTAVGAPVPPELVAKIMNPRGEATYSGPTGTLKGHVRIRGDAPPDTELSFPAGKCGEAAATYGRLFRVGQDGALADALVTVVGYNGFVPEKEEAEKVTIHGCALARRTLAVSFGQRVEVSNLDPMESYMPYLDGAPTRAVMVAVPRGDAVKLYPPMPGHYMIRDQLPKPFMTSDVFVLKYATHDVTDLDGEYEISGIPVGKATVVAYLPVLNDEVKQEIEIKEGENLVDLELRFDLAKWKERKQKKAGAPPAGSSTAARPTGAPPK
ncbi:MAG TPA: hypothetical protein VLS89_19635 [Candidatus Nanopelagicales bacterium]|nr:hypothetical protein [Candidatus Nanopelagicales bacterium]